MSLKDILVRQGSEAGLSFTEEQLEKFQLYYEMLVETNKVMNLTAITGEREVAIKHFIDSLLAWDRDFVDKKLADVGTGAGFPGIPLKIYCPSLQVTLIDSLGKRINFLEKVIDKLHLKNISCDHLRAEDAGRNKLHREEYDIVTARAVARLNVLAEYCLPLVKKGGRFIALKGSKYKDETEAGEKAAAVLGGKLEECREVKLPGLDDARSIIIIRKTGLTSPKFPRKAGTPERTPLGE
ncbi:MAG: 16S rRNA (guanine(527)-N(7))-methyltransferase RsmG [Acidaminococcaceae bacterium]|nr:16S rRNA (guanine(527)-N(7))-methyltransferase RsmG [Acidaminococcaceae bacterium]